MSDNGNKPNQMLPIYCSIMGLIIISLLAYVVYKLWKQREASKNAKLSDAYNIGCNKNNLLDRTTCVDNHHFQHHMISSDLLNHSPQSITEITKEASNNNNNNNNDLILGHEKEPLLGKSVGLNNSSDCLEQPLTVVPMNILGVICYRLSQHGWQDLANTMNLDTNKFDKATASNASDLLTATLEAQETVESHLKSCNPDNLNNNNNTAAAVTLITI
nr:unnamed protein product [Trichobilharzia regenti]